MTSTTARPIRCWEDTARSCVTSVPADGTDAVGALRLLAGGVRADGRPGDDGLGVDGDDALLVAFEHRGVGLDALGLLGALLRVRGDVDPAGAQVEGLLLVGDLVH